MKSGRIEIRATSCANAWALNLVMTRPHRRRPRHRALFPVCEQAVADLPDVAYAVVERSLVPVEIMIQEDDPVLVVRCRRS